MSQKIDTNFWKKWILRHAFALRQSWNNNFNTITEAHTITEAKPRIINIFVYRY